MAGISYQCSTTLIIIDVREFIWRTMHILIIVIGCICYQLLTLRIALHGLVIS